MAEFNGYVTVYESSDGGSGDPDETFWQFIVFDGSNNPVTTRNHRLARTMRLAIKMGREVKVSCLDDGATMTQARIEFEQPGPPGPPG